MSSITRTFLAIIAVSSIACSGDGSAGVAMSPQTYFTRLEAIADASMNKQLHVTEDMTGGLGTADSPSEASKIVRRALEDLLAILRTAQYELVALSPPEDVAGEHAAFLNTIHGSTRLLQRLIDDYDELGLEGVQAELLGYQSLDLDKQLADRCFALQQIADDKDIAVDLRCDE